MATNEQKLADIWWLLCSEAGRESFASIMGIYSKRDGGYTNTLISRDMVPTLGRIEGATTTLKTMVQAINAGNAEAIADAVIAEMGDGLAAEVATEIGKRLAPPAAGGAA